MITNTESSTSSSPRTPGEFAASTTKEFSGLRNSLRRGEEVLIPHLRIAESLWSRVRGLIAYPELEPNQALWIPQCRSIHTFLMEFPIDCVFVSSEGRVVRVLPRVSPWRMTGIQWGATAVIEMRSGQSESLKIRSGEVLHVGT